MQLRALAEELRGVESASPLLGFRRPVRSAVVRLGSGVAPRRTVDRVLGWKPERLAVCHGEVVDRDASQALERAFAFLPR